MSPDALLAQAISAWRRGEHYEAHEILEELNEALEDDPVDFAVSMALVHVAAALHKHVHRVTPEGVPGKLKTALLELADAPPTWRGIELSRVRNEIAQLLSAIELGQSAPLPKL